MSLKDLVITDQRLGGGNFGTVFICQLGEKRVAAKKLSESKEEFDSLSREASKPRRLRFGKYITYTYGIAEKEDNLYMVMEYSEHGDLQSYLIRNKESVTYEQKIIFCRIILLGLLYCHSMKILHGDIKCENVLLGKNLEPKLADFGLSVTVDNIAYYKSLCKGSLYWAAPELFSIRDETVYQEFIADPYPCDVYSLGATFCEISYDGTTEFIDSDDPAQDIILGIVYPIPKNAFLQEIIDGCCQFERNERISLDECLSALDNVAEEQFLVPAMDDKWREIQQDIKANSNFELSPSFILHRPSENLVIGPSNLSLLEWLCIKGCAEAVKYMIQLHNPDKKQLKWLYNISTLCGSPDAATFLQNMLQDNTTEPLALSDLIDLNPWQLIEAFIKAGANCSELDILDKAVIGHCNKVVQLYFKNASSYNTTAIHDAIKHENVEAVRIITNRIGLEYRDENGDTPLLAAINAGNVEIVKILLDHKVNVHNKNNRSQHILRIGGQHTPLVRAAVKGNHEIVELLISAGATIDTEGSEWHSLIQHLEKKRKSSTIQLISNAMRKRTKAVGNRSTETSISNNRSENEKSAESTPLCTAVRNRQSDIVQKFIGDGTDVSKHDYDKYSPLHWAVITGDIVIVRILLRAGADIDAKTPNEEQSFYVPSSLNYFNGCTSLHIAIVKRHLGIAKLLIEFGANFSLRNEAGQKIMDIANKDDKEEIERVIQECAPVTEDSSRWILETMSPETVEMLIGSRNANMDTLNHFLCIAVHYGNIEAIKYLLEHRANVNSKYKGKSPLEWAIFGGHAQIVQILIDHGTDIHSKGNNNHNSKGVIEALKNRSNDKRDEAQDLSGSLLHQAAALNNVGIVEVLLNAGVNIDIRDNNGYNALYHAALYGCDEVVVLLHGKGAKVRLWKKTEDSDAIYRTAKRIVYKAVEMGKINTGKIFADAGVRVDFENKSNSALSHIAMLDKSETAAVPSLSNNVALNTDLDKITTLTEAVKCNQLERVQLLLDAGAEINTKSTNGATPLFECVEESLVDMVQLLIKNGADVNARDKNGFAPIHCINDREIAEILIAHGADVNAKNIYGATPLFACVALSLVDMVQFLIEKGADVNAKDENGLAPINFAKNREIAEIVITHGADVNTKNIDGRTPLFECVRESLIDTVQFLVEKGADVNVSDIFGFTPIHLAKNIRIAEILIAHGADVNTKNANGRTPLSERVEESLVDMVQFLVEKGADVNTITEDGFAPIHLAKDKEIVETLIAYGVDVNVKNKYEETLLFVCVEKSLVDMVQLLIRKRADVNARNRNGFAPIHSVKDREIAEILIVHGADLNAKSKNGTTLLFRCVQESLMDMIQFLVEKGVDVNTRTERGYTPIHIAKNIRTAEILISHGADVNAKDTVGLTPLFKCVEESLVDMVQLLAEKGADVNAGTEDGSAPIHLAKDREIAEILIAHGADLNIKGTNGITLLSKCVKESLVDMVQLLVEKGADVNARDKDGFAPIHCIKDRKIAEILIAHGADVNTKSTNGITPLSVCVNESLTDMVQFLIENGADVNAKNEDGYAPIHFVKDVEVTQILISHSADVNARDIYGVTPLFVIVNKSLTDIVHFLIENGADVNARDNNGYAPIYDVNDREIAEILISHGADINIKNIGGATPLFGYVEKSLTDIAQFLIEKGTDVNARDEDGNAPIHHAKDRKIAEILITHGADVNTKSTNGITPLSVCVNESLTDMVQFLIENGADVNAKNEDDYAPIHDVNDREIAEVLISHGADINIKNVNGATPLFICVEKALLDMVWFLIEKGVDVNARDNDGCAPIHNVKDVEVAEVLISHGADVNTKNVNGVTLLFKCVEKALIDMVQFLIEKGADVSTRDNNGYAPIHYAKNRQTIDILIAHSANINVKNDDRITLFNILLEEQNKNLDSIVYKRKEVSELLEYLRNLE